MPFKGIFFHTFLIPNPWKGSFFRELFFREFFSGNFFRFQLSNFILYRSDHTFIGL